MIRKILPLILALIGLGAGVGAGVFLRPAQDHNQAELAASEETTVNSEFVKLNNQFVIPVVEAGRVVSLVIMSLSVEVELGSTEGVFSQEPKLRDAMLQVMFDHANAGGFSGVFTDGANLIVLRRSLTESAQKIMGDIVKDVLISDLARQDG